MLYTLTLSGRQFEVKCGLVRFMSQMWTLLILATLTTRRGDPFIVHGIRLASDCIANVIQPKIDPVARLGKSELTSLNS